MGGFMQDKVLARHGLRIDARHVMWDASPARLVEEAMQHHEGNLMCNGSLNVKTGSFTGRSPRDRFIVDTDDVHDKIAWGSVNKPFDEERFWAIKNRVLGYLSGREKIYCHHALAGADRRHSRKILCVNERASQNMFIQQLLVRPTQKEIDEYGDPDFLLLAAPGFKCDPELDGTESEAVVLVNFKERIIIVAGTGYSGEMKKSVFSVMNYLLPIEDDTLPMHCSANMDPITGETAVFFGLSGTGKTTLSADPLRKLIGDDEHGWAEEGVFNIEGGCYAKCIDLTLEAEPEIYRAIRFGSMCENVVMDIKDRIPDYSDSSITENTRVAYPVTYIDNAEQSGVGAVPSVVIFLTADAFGVLPPISRLSENAAMYHFVTGFTSKVAGTEEGVKEPQPTFSTLFGEPFMPLDPSLYAEMLGERIEKNKTRVYLVNTGWTGGPYGVGERMRLSFTRFMVSAALSGDLELEPFVHDDIFNVDIPQGCPGVPARIMNPRSTWQDKAAYDAAANRLAAMFEENCERKYPTMADEIRAAGPHAR
jgi:phosphoenolpyruvate carboxykinase (ATP)